MNIKHCTYRVTWSPEDGEHAGLCSEFTSLSWLAKTPGAALMGIQKVVANVVLDMQASGEAVPVALAEKKLQWRAPCAHPATAPSQFGTLGG